MLCIHLFLFRNSVSLRARTGPRTYALSTQNVHREAIKPVHPILDVSETEACAVLALRARTRPEIPNKRATKVR